MNRLLWQEFKPSTLFFLQMNCFALLLVLKTALESLHSVSAKCGSLQLKTQILTLLKSAHHCMSICFSLQYSCKIFIICNFVLFMSVLFCLH